MRNDISIVRAAAGAVVALTWALSGCAHRAVDENPPATSQTPAEEAGPSTAAAAPAEAGEPVQLQENAPLHYVVQKGDTLWGIANKFLKDSWQWPEVWYVNPKVQNPHLIYPGDELVLYFANGAPHIAKAGEGPSEAASVASAGPALPPGGMGDMRPHARETRLEEAIPAIPLDAIKAFLRGPRLVSEDELDDAPYIVDFENDHLMAATDDLAYAKNIEKRDVTQYQVVRRGQEYRDPDDNDVIGYEVVPVAESEVRVFGDPSTIYLSRSGRETLAGDYLLPLQQDELPLRFFPHAPAKTVDGSIISVYNGVSEIGQYQIVVINRGTQQGIEPGHVLSILQTNRKAKDPHSFFGRKVQLPDVTSGTIMVFKSTPRLSFALVWTATRAIHLYDKVEKPDASR